MSKTTSASSNNFNGSVGTWRSPSTSPDVLRTSLLYAGPRVRELVEPSQAAADLLLWQQAHNPRAALIGREMSAPFFADNPGATLTGAVAFVGCKAGQVPNKSLPFITLMQLLALERFGRSNPDVAPVALVGLESANRGLVERGSSGYEIACRYALKVEGVIWQLQTLFSRLTPILDCEVLCADEARTFSRARRERDVTDADRIATSLKALALSSGASMVKIGATNFYSLRELANARRSPSREQMHRFQGQTLAEDEQLRGEMAFLYGTGPASARLGQLVLTPEAIQAADWLQVDHLLVSEATLRQALAEHEQIDRIFRLVGELDPTLAIVDESIAWALDCSARMLEFHDAQLFENSTSGRPVSGLTLENLKRDYSRAMRTYLRDLAARNADWLLRLSDQIGFQVEAASHAKRSSDQLDPVSDGVIGSIGQTTKSTAKAA